MSVAFIFVSLLLFMMYVMYISGIQLKKRYRISSIPGIAVLLAFTLNEGLRFGRGIDYNAYWKDYDNLAQGYDNLTDIGYFVLEKTLIELGLSWQSCVLTMSFLFILSTLIFLKNFREIAYIIIPMWAMFTADTVNNLMRWNLAFSFVLIGLYFLMRNGNGKPMKFWAFCMLGCAFHYAMFPIPFLFYYVYKVKRPILHPVITISLFLIITFLFQTDFMLRFVDALRLLSVISVKFAGYGDNAEYWLTKGAGGNASPWIGGSVTCICLFLTIIGYSILKQAESKYIFVYNLFVIGFIFRPATIQVELLHRYDELFFYFITILFSYIIYRNSKKQLPYYKFSRLFLIFLSFWYMFNTIRVPFTERSFKYLYVWDSKGETADSMMELWGEDGLKKSK